jgi:hypothetical protein
MQSRRARQAQAQAQPQAAQGRTETQGRCEEEREGREEVGGEWDGGALGFYRRARFDLKFLYHFT